MRQFTILILISAMTSVFIQCTVKPSKRTHNNAVGIWIGGASPVRDGSETALPVQDGGETDPPSKGDNGGSWAVGAGIKHLNPKFISNSFFNVNTGIHFGEDYGISLDAGFNLLTDDLFYEFWLDGNASGGPFQLYAGPTLGAYLMSKKGKPFRLNPTLGISSGLVIPISKSKTYPESDISFDMRIPIEGLFMARLMHNLYLF